jgi:Bacterial PH domain
MTVFWGIVWLGLAFGSHKTNWTVMIVLGVWIVVISVWANVVAVKGGVYEGDDGITLRSFFGSTQFRWGDLDRFEHQRRGTHDIVYARLTDGSRRRLTNLLQGQRVLWDGGQTNDIVAVLSERLAERRAIRGDRS